jgi:hypothetical protein
MVTKSRLMVTAMASLLAAYTMSSSSLPSSRWAS